MQSACGYFKSRYPKPPHFSQRWHPKKLDSAPNPEFDFEAHELTHVNRVYHARERADARSLVRRTKQTNGIQPPNTRVYFSGCAQDLEGVEWYIE